MANNILIKRYQNFFGIDPKSSDLIRNENFASEVRNAQYRKTGAIESRRGYQALAPSKGGFGLFTYNRLNPTTGAEEPQIISVSDTVHVLNTATITTTYTGAAAFSNMSIIYDPVTSQYRAQIDEAGTLVLDKALGKGFDEAVIVTLSDLKTDIDALADYSAVISGDTTTPAAFLKIVKNHDLKISSLVAEASNWTDANKTVASPFAGSEANKGLSDFENVSASQMNNVIYLANGYDELHKYDGQTLYRAGLPKPASISTATGVGTLTGTDYFYRISYIQNDFAGNIYEGNSLATTSGISPTAQAVEVTVANILAGTGFNTNCAIVDGTQLGVNVITVDNGSGGSHTMEVGDKAYFIDSLGTPAPTTRNVTAVTGTTITIDGAAVDVNDNFVISNNLRIGLYRTKTGGSLASTFFLVGEFPNNSFSATQVITDNTADASLGAEFIAPIKDRGLPPKGKYLTTHQNLLFVAGKLDQPSTVFYSDIDGPEFFPATGNSFDVDTPSNDKISGLAPNNEVLTVFKDSSIFVVSGNIGLDDFRVESVTNDLGCISHASIQEVRGGLFFLTSRGPYSIVGGQIPEVIGRAPVGGGRLEPFFDQRSIISNDELFISKKSIAVHLEKEEKYILFVPAITVTGEPHANTNSRIFAYDYSRDAWLEWTNMNMMGGAVVLNDNLYWSERRFSSFNVSVDHILYIQHVLNSSLSYQDNTDPIDWFYKTHWETIGEPSVFKKFLDLKIFLLESLLEDTLKLTVKTEVNYIADNIKSEFDFDLSFGGYGFSSYGVDPYGDPSETASKKRLPRGKFKSLRIIFENNRDQENVLLSGWEIKCVAPYRLDIKR